jgi:hypothetical protein
VLAFRDDLSCGPVDPDNPTVRAAWWGQFYDEMDVYLAGNAFWDRVAATEDRLVVWFSRHAASEFAFFLAWAEHLGERPYSVIDITGRPLSFKRRDGTTVAAPFQAVGVIPEYALQSLLGGEQSMSAEERDRNRRDWQQLRAENAPFRIVTEAGLVSASVDYFDSHLLAQASPKWESIRRVVGNTMVLYSEPYFQVGDLMLLTRIVALVESGKLVADGDPWQMGSKIRLR